MVCLLWCLRLAVGLWVLVYWCLGFFNSVVLCLMFWYMLRGMLLIVGFSCVWFVVCWGLVFRALVVVLIWYFARFIVGWVCVSGLPVGVGFGFGLVLFRVNWCLGVLIYFVIAGCCCVWFVRR